ncbi:VOC family protein [Streptomyces sp. H10-C2]|uniref:VOC family protein n=1 Tax=unclassified Streptomyces TaxID=2593676 RepID=UPI0024BAC2CF|nr:MULTISPECIES: VOC family protein [unclassified Streptomyces]MDJ0343627.1 VOC family protein [Streptomyces sp. PH10-H1]MDJ0373125.1 VOC family protein [Streptomyces sp. H10-C2]
MDEETTTAYVAQLRTSDAVFGAPCWISLMARDLKLAQEFYGMVLGWEFRSGRLGEGFSVALADGAPVAGIGALATALQVAVAWTPYFAVGDADETAARISERSGTVGVGPLTLASGRGALAADRDGAVFGIWEGQLLTHWHTWRRDAPAWLRLRTRDAFDAAIFYGEVLDWACERPGCCEVEYEDQEVVLRSAGHVVARLSSGAVEAAPDPAVRPRWQVHFPVADVGACIRAAHKMGGTTVGQSSGPDGGQATLRDPDGGLFTVTARPPRT